MRKNIELGFLLILATFSLIVNTVKVSAQSNSSDNDFSLTLEQIYVITVLVGVLLAFLLERIGIIKDRVIIYRMLFIATIVLTIDYFVQRELILN
ncbi:MAG: hypothetical protein HeimC2_31570 [Candidatus Heimdallarchaeota archaeon LC_2]|nr:MAG: hypothetical protein HeimC2_31570 [Candidatus Heimdallarchaeota archaeon LC_2]